MATTFAKDQPSLALQSDLTSPAEPEAQDPFLASSTSSNHHRFSHFDNQLFALGPTASPDQAQRALEAHLAETERRIQEASKLGTTLVQQRKDLAERLKEVEKHQGEGDITPELRQKLVEIEREYNEVGRESARAFLPKSRVSSSEIAGSPFTGEKRSLSPSKFESQATNSPTKLSVPNRKQRNQPAVRVHDIEFATEISTSLLAQVRHLQALLAEKEDTLKEVTLEKSRLEAEAEGFNQRLRSLDESEHRYKDENWNLETQIHEHIAAAKEAADREKKLSQNLNIIQAEKIAAQKELDEIKLSHAKLSEEHTAVLKHHDVELGGVKRNMATYENDRVAWQRRIDDLTNQNQELAKAVAHQRGWQGDRDLSRGIGDEDIDALVDSGSPEHSPPPSPVKGTPRHSMLESETMKSSLNHAHRMIQNLKGNIHREKTEKLELKRLLQDARDELEARRNELGTGTGRKSRKVDSKEFKKPLKPGQLGGLRGSKSEVFPEDPNWEEDNGERSPSHGATGTGAGHGVDSSDHFETADETNDSFDTANERGTETEDFLTGAENLSGSDELTETEGGAAGTLRKKPAPLPLSKPGNRNSFQSTASASGDEYSYEDLKTPTAQSQPQRLRLKVNRGVNRRSRMASEEPQFQSSPASFANSSRNGTPQAPAQSLFAELGDMSDEDESVQGTPSRKLVSQSATPASRPDTARSALAGSGLSASPIPKFPLVAMVDSGMMTDPWEPQPPTPQTAVPLIAGGMVGAGMLEVANSIRDKHASTDTQIPLSEAAGKWHDEQLNNMLKVKAEDLYRPISTSTYSDRSSQYDPGLMDEKLAKFPAPPTSVADNAVIRAAPLPKLLPTLTVSAIRSEHVEPVAESPATLKVPEQPRPSTPKANPVPTMAFSSIQSVATEPTAPLSPDTPKQAVVMPLKDGPGLQRDTPTKRDNPETPKASLMGSVFGWNKNKAPSTPVIAEDETRQSPSDSPKVETPESQRPFKEVSGNTSERSPKKSRVITVDESSQTALTAGQIDEMLKAKRKETILAEDNLKVRSPQRGDVPTALRVRKSQESIGSVGRARAKMAEPGYFSDTAVIKRPTSAGSGRNGSISSIHPPLPTDHKQVIAEAAKRTGSAGGVPGSMGPPPLPASAFRPNPSFRPRTPSGGVPLSPASPRAGTTPRPLHSSSNVQSPPGTARSRRSSVSSFASEIDNRFNLRNNNNVPHGIVPGTDPRMINAITQTMIGEFLWKYTRKAGRGAMSENRHRRYFWVHPYTRTLYWSDRDPASAGRAELKAKSVPIEAVRVVTDDNPMPPGLHRKSLVVITPGRSVKFTASTGQRHETWFNALSYLLLRTADDNAVENADVGNGNLTKEDVDEFNPSFGGNHNNSTTVRRGPTSLSSYNSRTTRNESPTRAATRLSMQPPTLTPQKSTSSRPTMGTFSRISSYWRPAKEGQVGSSSRSRHSVTGAGSIYEASEVHDSAEDLREMIEKQDRESDKLENVRACCDGKHDVGHLHQHSVKGRHSSGAVPMASTSSRHAPQREKSKGSLIQRSE